MTYNKFRVGETVRIKELGKSASQGYSVESIQCTNDGCHLYRLVGLRQIDYLESSLTQVGLNLDEVALDKLSVGMPVTLSASSVIWLRNPHLRDQVLHVTQIRRKIKEITARIDTMQNTFVDAYFQDFIMMEDESVVAQSPDVTRAAEEGAEQRRGTFENLNAKLEVVLHRERPAGMTIEQLKGEIAKRWGQHDHSLDEHMAAVRDFACWAAMHFHITPGTSLPGIFRIVQDLTEARRKNAPQLVRNVLPNREMQLADEVGLLTEDLEELRHVEQDLAAEKATVRAKDQTITALRERIRKLERRGIIR